MDFIDIVFAKGFMVGPDSEFIESERSDGSSFSAGEWVVREDGFTALRIRPDVFSEPDSAEETPSEPDSGCYRHAKKELELAGMLPDVSKDPSEEWNRLTGEAVLALMKVFVRQGHSGASASVTSTLFQKLVEWENLTPITNNPDDWEDVAGSLHQCKRNPSLFSNDGLQSYYHVDTPNDKKVFES